MSSDTASHNASATSPKSNILPKDYELLETLLIRSRACLILIVDDVVVFRYPTTDFQTTCFDANFVSLIRQNLPSNSANTASKMAQTFFNNNNTNNNNTNTPNANSPTVNFASSPTTSKTHHHFQQQQHNNNLSPQQQQEQNLYSELLAKQNQLHQQFLRDHMMTLNAMASSSPHFMQNPCEILGRPELAFSKALSFNSFHQHASQSVMRFGNLTLIVNPISNLDDRNVVESGCTLVFAMEELSGAFASEAQVCKLLWDFRCGLVQSHFSTLTSSVSSSGAAASFSHPHNHPDSNNAGGGDTTTAGGGTSNTNNNNNNKTKTAQAPTSSTSFDERQHGSFTRLSLQALRALRSKAGTTTSTPNLFAATNLAKTNTAAAAFLLQSGSGSSSNNSNNTNTHGGAGGTVSSSGAGVGPNNNANTSATHSNVASPNAPTGSSSTAASPTTAGTTAKHDGGAAGASSATSAMGLIGTPIQKDLLVAWNVLAAIAHHKLGLSYLSSGNQQQSTSDISTATGEGKNNSKTPAVDAKNNKDGSLVSSPIGGGATTNNNTNSTPQHQDPNNNNSSTSASPANSALVLTVPPTPGSVTTHHHHHHTGSASLGGTATDLSFPTTGDATLDSMLSFDNDNTIIGSVAFDYMTELVPMIFANGSYDSNTNTNNQLHHHTIGNNEYSSSSSSMMNISHRELLQKMTTALLRKRLPHISRYEADGQILEKLFESDFRSLCHSIVLCQELVCLFHSCKQLLELTLAAQVQKISEPRTYYGTTKDVPSRVYLTEKSLQRAQQVCSMLTVGGVPSFHFPIDLTEFSESGAGSQRRWAGRNPSSIGFAYFAEYGPPFINCRLLIDEERVFELASQIAQHVSLKAPQQVSVSSTSKVQQQSQQQQPKKEKEKEKEIDGSAHQGDSSTKVEAEGKKNEGENTIRNDKKTTTASSNDVCDLSSSDDDEEEEETINNLAPDENEGDSFYTTVSEIESRVFPLVLRCALIDLLRAPPPGAFSSTFTSANQKPNTTSGGNNSFSHHHNHHGFPKQNSSSSSTPTPSPSPSIGVAKTVDASGSPENFGMGNRDATGIFHQQQQPKGHRRNLSHQPPLPTSLLLGESNNNNNNNNLLVSDISTTTKTSSTTTRTPSPQPQRSPTAPPPFLFPNAYTITDAQLRLTSNTFKQLDLHDLYAALIQRGKQLIHFELPQADQNSKSAKTLSPEFIIRQQLEAAMPRETFHAIQNAHDNLWLVAAVLFVWAHVLNRGETSGGKVAGRSKNKFGGNFTITWKQADARKKQQQQEVLQQVQQQQKQQDSTSSTTGANPSSSTTPTTNNNNNAPSGAATIITSSSLSAANQNHNRSTTKPPPPPTPPTALVTSVVAANTIGSSGPSRAMSSIFGASNTANNNNTTNQQQSQQQLLYMIGEDDFLRAAPPIHHVADVGLRYALVDLIPSSWFYTSTSEENNKIHSSSEVHDGSGESISGGDQFNFSQNRTRSLNHSNLHSGTISPASASSSQNLSGNIHHQQSTSAAAVAGKSSSTTTTPTAELMLNSNNNNTATTATIHHDVTSLPVGKSNPFTSSTTSTSNLPKTTTNNNRHHHHDISSSSVDEQLLLLNDHNNHSLEAHDFEPHQKENINNNDSTENQKTTTATPTPVTTTTTVVKKKRSPPCPFGSRPEMCIFCNRLQFPLHKKDALDGITKTRNFNNTAENHNDDDEASSSLEARKKKLSTEWEEEDTEITKKNNNKKKKNKLVRRLKRELMIQKERESVQLLSWLRYVLDNSSLAKDTVKILKKEVPQHVPLWAGWVSSSSENRSIFMDDDDDDEEGEEDEEDQEETQEKNTTSTQYTSSTTNPATSSSASPLSTRNQSAEDEIPRKDDHDNTTKNVSAVAESYHYTYDDEHHLSSINAVTKKHPRRTAKTNNNKRKSKKGGLICLEGRFRDTSYGDFNDDFFDESGVPIDDLYYHNKKKNNNKRHHNFITNKDSTDDDDDEEANDDFLLHLILGEIELEIEEWLQCFEQEVDERLDRIATNRSELVDQGLFTVETLRAVIIEIAKHDCRGEIALAREEVRKVKMEKLLEKKIASATKIATMISASSATKDEEEQAEDANHHRNENQDETAIYQDQEDEEETEDDREEIMIRVLENMQNQQQPSSSTAATTENQPLRLTALVSRLLGDSFQFNDLDALHELMQAFDDVIFVSF